MSNSATVAPAMIVRDEERFLPGCLKSPQSRIDEIIIVDMVRTVPWKLRYRRRR